MIAANRSPLRLVRRVLVPALVLFGVGCSRSDSTVSPEESRRGAGALGFTVSLPDDDNAALWLSVRGGAVDSAVAPGLRILSMSSDANRTQLLVRGTLRSATTLQVFVPELAIGSQYVLTVDQAVARGTYAQRPVEQYRVTRAH